MTVSVVTGGAGFIGSHLVRDLLARGDQVRVLDNFSTGRPENLMDLNGSLDVLEGDIRDSDVVKGAVQGVDLIFHLAAMVSVPQSMEKPLVCGAINEQATLSLLETARKSGVGRVVLASSCAVYGDSEQLPLNENADTQPLSPYAVSKLTTEAYARLYAHVFDLPVVALRYFNVYGSRQRPDSPYAAVIPIFVNRMLAGKPPIVHGDGTQKRDFVYVKDVVRANLLAAEVQGVEGGVYNVCTGKETSILELLDILVELIPQAPPYQFDSPRAGDIHRSLGDPSLAANAVGFKAQVSLLDGLSQIVERMRL